MNLFTHAYACATGFFLRMRLYAHCSILVASDLNSFVFFYQIATTNYNFKIKSNYICVTNGVGGKVPRGHVIIVH
jgi:hypothetical protein